MDRQNLCQREWAGMTSAEQECARRIFEEDYPDDDLQALLEGNSAVAAYYLRCGRLGFQPEDGE